jgi:hypothetical protein
MKAPCQIEQGAHHDICLKSGVYDQLVTVTIQVDDLFPSIVVTVMIAVPTLLAVTLPFASTVAILGLLDVHVTVLLVAFVGSTVAIKLKVLSRRKVMLVLFRLTPLTAIIALIKLTVLLPVMLPFLATTLMLPKVAWFVTVTTPVVALMLTPVFGVAKLQTTATPLIGFPFWSVTDAV